LQVGSVPDLFRAACDIGLEGRYALLSAVDNFGSLATDMWQGNDGMNLYLRKVIHPQVHENYRVVLKLDDDEFEIGSIGIQFGAAWAWRIDTVIPKGAPQVDSSVVSRELEKQRDELLCQASLSKEKPA
jgi:hypothetical protein